MALKVRIGPPSDLGSACACGRPAVAKCDGCGSNLCGPHWWRHGHRMPDGRMDFTRARDLRVSASASAPAASP
jgi:hypothetical protein